MSTTNVGVAYSFLDYNITLQGMGGTVSLGAGAGSAEEGFSVEFLEETDTMKIGADGQAMHSLHAGRSGRVIVRLQKTSPTNNLLTQLYNYERQSGLLFAQDTLVVTSLANGDNYTCTGVAFARFPRNDFPREAGNLEWEFNCSYISPFLGSNLNLQGTPTNILG